MIRINQSKRIDLPNNYKWDFSSIHLTYKWFCLHSRNWAFETYSFKTRRQLMWQSRTEKSHWPGVVGAVCSRLALLWRLGRLLLVFGRGQVRSQQLALEEKSSFIGSTKNSCHFDLISASQVLSNGLMTNYERFIVLLIPPEPVMSTFFRLTHWTERQLTVSQQTDRQWLDNEQFEFRLLAVHCSANHLFITWKITANKWENNSQRTGSNSDRRRCYSRLLTEY